MSQNSHAYGQPLENWMLAMKYSRKRISSYAGVGPAEVVIGCRARVLVDESDVPRLGQIRGHREQPLGRHERAHAPAEERVRVLESAERASVDRIHAEDPAPRGRGVGRAHGTRFRGYHYGPREDRSMDLASVRAVVTGGASGLGRATAARLAGAGARVAILDRPASPGADVA